MSKLTMLTLCAVILCANAFAQTTARQTAYATMYSPRGDQYVLRFLNPFDGSLGYENVVGWNSIIPCRGSDRDGFDGAYSLTMNERGAILLTADSQENPGLGPDRPTGLLKEHQFYDVAHEWESEGLRILRTDSSPIEPGNEGALLIIPKSPEWVSGVDENGSCPDAGFARNLIHAVIDLDQLARLHKWALSANASVKEALYQDSDPDRPVNLYFLSVPTGEESNTLRSLQKENWVISAKREGIGAGPGMVGVHFSVNRVLGGELSQRSVSSALKEALSQYYGEYIVEGGLQALRGTEFQATISGPAEEVLSNDSRFRGHWIRAELSFAVYRRFEDGDNVYLEFGAQDGFLPRWNRNEPPPFEHIASAHLSPYGKDHRTDFTAIIDLQKRLADEIAANWGGTADIPDF